MSTAVQVGTILIREWPGMPQLSGFKAQKSFGDWSTVTLPDGFALDREIHAAGWNFFFMASEVQATFFGSPAASKIENALKRILAKVRLEHFNGLEITAIVARHFLGVPYVTVSAHSRHMQQGCSLESAGSRQSSQDNAEWAKG